MKIVGIIAEYNPFHSGHAYHLKMAKKQTGSAYAVVVMSPDFVQRGEPALLSKYIRTRMALENGADLVLELPLLFACGSAEYFADGGVFLLDALGCIDSLCFGCETEHVELFSTLADFFLMEPEEYRKQLLRFLKEGKTFPEARADALISYMGRHPDFLSKTFSAPVSNDEWRSLLSAPNNILGLEYVKALKKRGSSILPYPLKRQGSDYHDPTLKGEFCSASAIRSALQIPPENGPISFSASQFSAFLPETALALLQREAEADHLVRLDDFSTILHYRLLSGRDFSRYLDVGAELSDRIIKLLPQYRTALQFVSLLKTRQITQARIRRALLHILLNITSEQAVHFRRHAHPGYARILGFRREAAPLLHRIKETSAIPLIAKPANAKKILNAPALQMFTQDIFASHVYQSILTSRSGLSLPNEFTRSPIML